MERNFYLRQLLERLGNGLIKVVTGIRRCGKSYLVFTLFKNHLLEEQGVPPERIISLALDEDSNSSLRNPMLLGEYLRERITSKSERFYVLIDEIQYCYRVKRDGIDESQVAPEDRDSLYITFYDVLNGLLHMGNVEVYVTGSNSKMLSDDVKTIFRGRGDEIRVHPFSFAEYHSCMQGDRLDEWEDYLTYGGMPLAVLERNVSRRRAYLNNLYEEVYLKDLVERNKIRDIPLLENLLDVLSSSVGSLTNPTRLANALNSANRQNDTTANTIEQYIRHLMQAYLFSKAKRYDVKGKKYMETPYKLYSEDVGIRNARLNWRQQERTHLMENVIFNELLYRGYTVDVGVIETREMKDGKSEYRQYEIDFIAANGNEKYYIQSAYELSTETKREQELQSLKRIDDSFQKIVIVKDDIMPYRDEKGIFYTGLFQFLTSDKLM